MAVYRVSGVYLGTMNQEDLVGLQVLDALPQDHPTVKTAQILVPLVMLQHLEAPCCQSEHGVGALEEER